MSAEHNKLVKTKGIEEPFQDCHSDEDEEVKEENYVEDDVESLEADVYEKANYLDKY